MFYSDYKTNLLYSRVSPWRKVYFIKEPISEMNWQLHDKTKTNNENIKLHKATINFRGRNYTAWYSIDYPIHIGPWKFNNLPGLAFEITEEDKQYHWQLTKIELNTFKVLPMKYDISRATMTLQTYLTSYQAEVENYDMGLSRLFGSIPGVEVLETITDGNDFKKSRNMDLERKYEWEE
ncbi:MAG: GLPGLI family protein [Flavobacterium sp.]